MKTFIYPRLAWDGIRKNKRLVFPYVLTCICVISVFYILAFLGTYSFGQIISMGLATCLLECIIGVCDTPFLYMARRLRNGNENEAEAA